MALTTRQQLNALEEPLARSVELSGDGPITAISFSHVPCSDHFIVGLRINPTHKDSARIEQSLDRRSFPLPADRGDVYPESLPVRQEPPEILHYDAPAFHQCFVTLKNPLTLLGKLRVIGALSPSQAEQAIAALRDLKSEMTNTAPARQDLTERLAAKRAEAYEGWER
ncbi:MAG: hypothetical protein K2Q12_00820 [Rickettsiales bacterium]|nr:hypothetical protein [Rickettsiales bacterium]